MDYETKKMKDEMRIWRAERDLHIAQSNLHKEKADALNGKLAQYCENWAKDFDDDTCEGVN